MSELATMTVEALIELLTNWGEIKTIVFGTALIIAIAFGILIWATEPRARPRPNTTRKP